jgi:NAD(P)-dependent dehydrogenase (short-subunit alcohol dehydrogenase family)
VTGQPQLAGRRVVVTGAGRGLGREFTLHLARLGAQVLAVDIDPEGLAETGELAARSGEPLATAIADVGDRQQTEGLAESAVEKLGGLDALINNAAVVAGLSRRSFEEIDETEWDRVLAVNVKGAWLCAKATVPLMRAAGGGAIVKLASEVAFSGSPGLAHYVTSKAAVIGLTRALARELGGSHIRVNALAPGFIPTQASRDMLADGEYDTSATPLGRVGRPICSEPWPF